MSTKPKSHVEQSAHQQLNITSSTRARRRPMLLALGVLIIALSCIGGYLVFNSAGNTQSVLATSTIIRAGEIIRSDQLVVVEINQQSRLDTISSHQADSIIGKHAMTDIPSGTVIPSSAVGDKMIPARGYSLVGILLHPGSSPAISLAPGTHVRLVLIVPPEINDQASFDPISGTIVDVQNSVDGSGVIATVEIPLQNAPEVQMAAAQQLISIVIDAEEN